MDSLEGATKLAIPFEVCRPTSVVFCFCNCSNVRVCVFLWIFSVCVRPPTSKRAVATETKTTTTAKVTTFLVSCQLAALPNKSANKLICHCHCNCLANSQQKYTAQLEQSFHTNTHTHRATICHSCEFCSHTTFIGLTNLYSIQRVFNWILYA